MVAPLLFQLLDLAPLQLPVGDTFASCFTNVLPAVDEEEEEELVGGWLRSPASVGGVGKLSAAVPSSGCCCCW